MKVQQIMTTDVRTCAPEDKLATAAMTMWENDCGVVPVVNGAAQVVGIITDRDICMAVTLQHRLAAEIAVGAVSANQITTCQQTDDVRDALALMRREQLRRLPVTDDTGRLVGILSLSDVVRHVKKGESKKGKHVSPKELLRTLKALTKPAKSLPDDDDDEPATVVSPDFLVESETIDL
jgi:CBS domain-containing protein